MSLLTSLRYLLALQQYRHFGRAAQACHITQPALSNAIRALEREFETPIVKRARSFEGFTPEGELILQSAQRMLREQELLQQALQSAAGQPVGRLTLGAAWPASSVTLGTHRLRRVGVSMFETQSKLFWVLDGLPLLRAFLDGPAWEQAARMPSSVTTTP